mgnify:CR=1 FL=1
MNAHFHIEPNGDLTYRDELWREAFLAPDVPSPLFIEYVSDLPDRTIPVPDALPIEQWGGA